MAQHDPYQTRPLPDLGKALARPVTLSVWSVVALSVAPALFLALMLLWSSARQPALLPVLLTATPTLGVPRVAAPASGLPKAVIAYDAPGGAVVGALEPGRAYVVVARSGLEWAQLNVARPLEPANLVWVAAREVPEISVAASVTDLATPVPTLVPQVVSVAASPASVPAQPGGAPALLPAPAELEALPEPPPVYLIPPVTQTPRSVVVVAYPTATPCRLRALGTSLRPCNGVVP